MTEPKRIPDVPNVHLNGKDWPVPEFGPRCLRECREQIKRANDAILLRRDDDPAIPEGGDEIAVQRARAEFGKRAGERYAKLSNDVFGDMCDAVYWGLKVAHRDLSRDEFDDWPMTDDEVFAAFLVARRQSGIFGRFRSEPAGEAVAAKDGSQSAI